MILKILAQLGLDGRGFRAGLMQAEKASKDFSRSLVRNLAGAFTIGAIGHQIKKAIDEASRINDMSRALGVSTDKFQELEFAAKQTGASMEIVNMAIKKIAQAQQAALTGKAGNENQQLFERLGFSMEKIKQIRPEDIFDQVAAAIHKGAIGSGQMADILDLLGKRGNELMPMMQEGFAGMALQARQMGLIIDEDIIGRLDDMGDQLDILKTKWAALRAEGVVKAAGAMDTVWKTWVGAYGAYSTLFTGGGFDKAQQAWEAAWEDAAEEEAQTRETLALKAAQRARGLVAAAPGEIFTPAKEIESTKRGGAFSAPSDALARIGGFVGGAGRNRGIEIAEKQLKKLDSIEDYVRRVVFGVL